MRTLIFGDVGGHDGLFDQALLAVGADSEKNYIPEDITIIQVGDLVDKGPNSDKCLVVAAGLIDLPNYIQLIGNHEGRFLGGPKFDTPKTLSVPSESGIALIKHWVQKDKMKVAAGVRTSHGAEYLITHAGVAHAFWTEYLASETSLEKVVGFINEMHLPAVLKAGVALGEDDIPGPTWTSTVGELMMPWLMYQDMPWNQIHGHQAIAQWNANKKRYSELDHLIEYDWEHRHTRVLINNDRYLHQIDPGLSVYSSWVPKPFIIDNVVDVYI